MVAGFSQLFELLFEVKYHFIFDCLTAETTDLLLLVWEVEFLIFDDYLPDVLAESGQIAQREVVVWLELFKQIIGVGGIYHTLAQPRYILEKVSILIGAELADSVELDLKEFGVWVFGEVGRLLDVIPNIRHFALQLFVNILNSVNFLVVVPQTEQYGLDRFQSEHLNAHVHDFGEDAILSAFECPETLRPYVHNQHV